MCLAYSPPSSPCSATSDTPLAIEEDATEALPMAGLNNIPAAASGPQASREA